jgi:NADH:ubiquinone oxidoreductase subunit K
MSEIQFALLLGAFLFCAGLVVVLSRQNLIMMLLGLELMLNGAIVNWVAFGQLHPQMLQGEIFALFIIVVAVCETAVGVALVIRVFHYFRVSEPDEINTLTEK